MPELNTDNRNLLSCWRVW